MLAGRVEYRLDGEVMDAQIGAKIRRIDKNWEQAETEKYRSGFVRVVCLDQLSEDLGHIRLALKSTTLSDAIPTAWYFFKVVHPDGALIRLS
jgi:hypothetical protein